MPFRVALPRAQRFPRLLQSHRGAVFLLSVYLFSLALLMLAGVALQRTMLESRAAYSSRDLQRGFYLAEAGMERALVALRQTPWNLAEGVEQREADGSGTSTYAVSRFTGNPTWENAWMENVYEITATGAAASSNSTTRLGSTLAFGRQMSGFWANEYLAIAAAYWGNQYHPITVRGDIGSARGQRSTVDIEAGVTVDGRITINRPEAEAGYERLYGSTIKDGIFLDEPDEWDRRWARWDRRWGDNYGMLRKARSTDGYDVEPAAPYPTVEPPTECSDVPWRVTEATYHLRDGDPLDQSAGGRTDRQVVICAPYGIVQPDAKLIVHDETVLYLTDTDKWGSAFTNSGMIDVASNLQRRPARGFTIVVTAPPKVTTSSTGRTIRKLYVDAGDFEGSVYAPQATVSIGASGKEWRQERRPRTRRFGYVVGGRIYVDGVPVEFNRSGRTQQQSATGHTPRQPSFLLWTHLQDSLGMGRSSQ